MSKQLGHCLSPEWQVALSYQHAGSVFFAIARHLTMTGRSTTATDQIVRNELHEFASASHLALPIDLGALQRAAGAMMHPVAVGEVRRIPASCGSV